MCFFDVKNDTALGCNAVVDLDHSVHRCRGAAMGLQLLGPAGLGCTGRVHPAGSRTAARCRGQPKPQLEAAAQLRWCKLLARIISDGGVLLQSQFFCCSLDPFDPLGAAGSAVP